MWRAVCIFLIGASLITPATASVSPLTTELLEEDLLTMSEVGQPMAECVVSDEKGMQQIEYCPITPGFGHRSVGCMALWKDTLLLKQGCYSGQDLSLEDQCRKGSCLAADPTKPVQFCCCFGPQCNRDYTELF